jgi:hypothetical protein
LRRRDYVAVGVLLGLSMAGGALISRTTASSASRNAGSPTTAIRLSSARRDEPAALDWRAAQRDIPPYPECLGHPIAHCVLVHGRGKRVLLMGDSLARMWLPAFIAIAKRESLTLGVAIHPACPWPRNLNGLGISPDCQKRREDWYKRVIPDFNPQIVFLANRPYDAPGNELTIEVKGHILSTKSPIAIHAIALVTKWSIGLLRRPGRELVLLEPTPVPVNPSYDPMTCVATGNPHCSFTVSRGTAPLTNLDRDLAIAPDVWSLNLNRLVCPRFPVCDSVVRGMIVRRDHTHLTATYARALTGQLDAMLHQQHVLGAAPRTVG